MEKVYITNRSEDKNEFMGFQSVAGQSALYKSILLRMGSLKLFLIALVMIPLLWSCEFLNYNEYDQYSKDQILSYQNRTEAILTNIYSYLPTDFNGVGLGIDGAMRSSASDDAKDVWDVSDIRKLNDGSWNSTVLIDDQLNKMYAGIRAANVFLKEAPGLTFPDTKYNVGYEDGMKMYNLYPYEARFLRAFFYFELIKRYGNVPLDTTVLTQEEVNKVSPASYDDIVKFIVRECDAAAAKLPVTFSTFVGGETGRATKGAAMALKARTLLYAASPLHNPTNDQAKWIAAAKASKAIIDSFAGTYTPLPVYTAAVNDLSSKELIFETRRQADRLFESANTAIGFVGGNTGTCPTQNLVDSYEMLATGKGILEAGSGYDAANPYTGRDPRFAMTILYNGAIWRTQTVQTWYGGLNAPPTKDATQTGYYLKKYMVESVSLDPTNPGTADHYWIIFRYGEVLLNYSEAMNEAYGPELNGPAPLNDLTALAAVNLVRARTGVEMPAFPVGETQSAFRTKLRNERRVELAFEDHRFWDIRRWEIGPSTTTIRGVDITKDALGNLTFTPKTVETRYWNDKMYLYPIPQTERFINPNLVQNQGW
jgi:starch-binding outer membrane protein, SusD/RagB family